MPRLPGEGILAIAHVSKLQPALDPAITFAMETMDTGIPWSTPAAWHEANESLAHALRCHHDRLTEAFRLAERVHHRLTAIFPVMDALCGQTCPACADICCTRAWVWADFRDLLFLHLADIPVPEGQLLSRRDEHCRYGSPRGCHLDRLQRPFVCTWYVCPSQTRVLDRQPAVKTEVTATLTAVKKDRRRMEEAFIRVVFR